MSSVGASANTHKKVTVKTGDTVSQIAKEYSTSVKKIKKVNNLKDASVIRIGEKLILPPHAHKADTSTKQNVQTPAAQAPAAQTNNIDKPAVQAAKPAQAPAAPAVSRNVAAAPKAKAANTSTASTASNAGLSGIASAESGGSYTARNGQYVGKYQLSSSYLHGDYSAANQEKVAHQYAVSRYGSVSGAAAFRQSHGWW